MQAMNMSRCFTILPSLAYHPPSTYLTRQLFQQIAQPHSNMNNHGVGTGKWQIIICTVKIINRSGYIRKMNQLSCSKIIKKFKTMSAEHYFQCEALCECTGHTPMKLAMKSNKGNTLRVQKKQFSIVSKILKIKLSL